MPSQLRQKNLSPSDETTIFNILERKEKKKKGERYRIKIRYKDKSFVYFVTLYIIYT